MSGDGIKTERRRPKAAHQSRTVVAGTAAVAVQAVELAHQVAPSVIPALSALWAPAGSLATIALGAATIYYRLKAVQPIGR